MLQYSLAADAARAQLGSRCVPVSGVVRSPALLDPICHRPVCEPSGPPCIPTIFAALPGFGDAGLTFAYHHRRSHCNLMKNMKRIGGRAPITWAGSLSRGSI